MIPTYIHACIQAHAHVHTYIHTCIQACMQAYIQDLYVCHGGDHSKKVFVWESDRSVQNDSRNHDYISYLGVRFLGMMSAMYPEMRTKFLLQGVAAAPGVQHMCCNLPPPSSWAFCHVNVSSIDLYFRDVSNCFVASLFHLRLGGPRPPPPQPGMVQANAAGKLMTIETCVCVCVSHMFHHVSKYFETWCGGLRQHAAPCFFVLVTFCHSVVSNNSKQTKAKSKQNTNGDKHGNRRRHQQQQQPQQQQQ